MFTFTNKAVETAVKNILYSLDINCSINPFYKSEFFQFCHKAVSNTFTVMNRLYNKKRIE